MIFLLFNLNSILPLFAHADERGISFLLFYAFKLKSWLIVTEYICCRQKYVLLSSLIPYYRIFDMKNTAACVSCALIKQELLILPEILIV